MCSSVGEVHLAQDDHLVVEQCFLDAAAGAVVERAGQVETEDLGAQRHPERTNLHGETPSR